MHVPVLLQEVIDGLALSAGLTVLDGTINGAGHGLAIAKLIPGGYLIGLDRDAAAITQAEKILVGLGCKVSLAVGNFRKLGVILDGLGISTIDRLFLDLGFSSNQLAAGRGFSFRSNEPLIMTYESEPAPNQLTAREIVNRWPIERLTQIFHDYGDEPFARRISRAIVRVRAGRPIETTVELVAVIRLAVPIWYRSHRRRHFATKIFQALRIAVNDELTALEEVIRSGWDRLNPRGRIAIIAFHSGEARIIKNFFQTKVADRTGRRPSRRVIKPSEEEIKANPRASSATLRLIEKI